MKRIYTYMCLLLLSVCSFAVAGCEPGLELTGKPLFSLPV